VNRTKLGTTIGITAAAIILIACGSGGGTTTGSGGDKAADSSKTATAAPAKSTKPGKPSDKGWVLESVKMGSSLGDFEGTARVTNTNDSEQTATMTVTVFKGGQQVGSLQGSVNQVSPGKTVTVQLISTDKFVKGPWKTDFQIDASF
jgi:hypothetical protein